MPSASEPACQLPHVDIGASAAPYNLYFVIQSNGGDDGIETFESRYLLHDLGIVAAILIVRAGCQQDFVPVEIHGLAVMEQIVEQRDLLGIERAFQCVGDDG